MIWITIDLLPVPARYGDAVPTVEGETSRAPRGALALVSLVVVGCAVSACAGPSDTAPLSRPSPTVSSASPHSTSVAVEDITFVQLMLAHDRQTVQICDLLLAKDGVDPRVRALAEQLRRTRSLEIDQLTIWLSDWGIDESPLEHDHAGRTHGLLLPGQLAAFERADGPTAQRAFLETMISHDRGALEISTTVVDTGTDSGVRQLAEKIISSQSAEIDRLEQALGR